MNKVLVTGANGQLGSEIIALESDYRDYEFYFTDIHNLDLTDHKAVKANVVEHGIDVIINCAAYTAVDKAEEEFEMADKINHLAVANFAQIAKDNNIKLVHISTDYVFNGTSHIPYTEKDKTNPQSVYGRTKLAGEKAMMQINPKNSIIIRTAWVYSRFGNNFVKTMLRLAKDRDTLNVVADQVGSPTYAANLAKAILDILPKLNDNTIEIYHYTNQGVCSWYDFAKTIFAYKKIDIKVNAIVSSQYPTPAERPFYSVLNKNKIENKFQIEIPYWRNSLQDCLQKL